ncbi:hypothetical protein ABDK56_07525 [Sphingomonas sp. ASV193]|uniref:hypothetical protein n=1 Tax=Sphingomonas sp. ASV193 TaxID=3144405 RepID=UPI0032E8D8B9
MRWTLWIALALVAACKNNDPVAKNAVAPPDNVVGDASATGLAAPANAAAAEVAKKSALPPVTDGMRWTASAGGKQVDYGAPGAVPALSIACAAGPARLVVVRGAAAPDKGVGTLSLTGGGHVASLPMVASGAGTERVWRAEAMGDLRSGLEKAFGGGPVEITLAGTGDLVVSPEPMVTRLFAACR